MTSISANTSTPTTASADTPLNQHDTRYLRYALQLAVTAKNQGRHPFGAVVVDTDGTILAEAGNNSMPPGGDPTQHAERVAAAQAAQRATPAILARATLYTNAEPCAMCAGAIYWCGIGRVVYALSEQQLLALTGNHPENPTLSLPCRTVFASGQRPIDVVGPLPQFEAEAAAPHIGFWS